LSRGTRDREQVDSDNLWRKIAPYLRIVYCPDGPTTSRQQYPPRDRHRIDPAAFCGPVVRMTTHGDESISADFYARVTTLSPTSTPRSLGQPEPEAPTRSETAGAPGSGGRQSAGARCGTPAASIRTTPDPPSLNQTRRPGPTRIYRRAHAGHGHGSSTRTAPIFAADHDQGWEAIDVHP
jgi:hypothetical protein